MEQNILDKEETNTQLSAFMALFDDNLDETECNDEAPVSLHSIDFS